MEATDVFIIALAISDMMFSLAIHPMLIATSFGANSYKIFSSSGEGKVPDIIIVFFSRLQLVRIRRNVLRLSEYGYSWQYQPGQISPHCPALLCPKAFSQANLTAPFT